MTSDGRIDFKKIVDFRLMLKRRYFYNTKLSKTFMVWTGNNSDNRVSHENIQERSRALGFPLNMKESKCLINIACGKKSSSMECTDFFNLIFNDQLFDKLVEGGLHNIKHGSYDSFTKLLDNTSKSVTKDNIVDHLRKVLNQRKIPSKINKEQIFSLCMNSSISSSNHFDHILNEMCDDHKSDDGQIDLSFLMDNNKSLNEVQNNDSGQLKYVLSKNKREIPINQIELNFSKIVKVKL